jgi:hypothetical protein
MPNRALKSSAQPGFTASLSANEKSPAAGEIWQHIRA